VKLRSAPFPPPLNPEYPTRDWAYRLFDEWMADGRPDLDGAALDQFVIAQAVVRGDKRASRQPSEER
jgi:hypothetical protein